MNKYEEMEDGTYSSEKVKFIRRGTRYYNLMLSDVEKGLAVVEEYVGSDREKNDQASVELSSFNAKRNDAVAILTVVVDGFVFDANERSQSRMATRLASINLDEQIKWKSHDNKKIIITGFQLKKALKLAGDATTTLLFSA